MNSGQSRRCRVLIALAVLGGFVGFASGAYAAEDPQSSEQNPQPRREALQEVVVTAEKREERLQDVPVPVTVLSAETLVDTNQLRLSDYYSRVPGLNMTTSTTGQPIIEIRGLGGVGPNPTVGVTVDDVPYGSTIGTGGGVAVADLDPSDLASIEVLRGPQGTLYGASSIGGLLKYVTVDPSTQGITGRVQADTYGIYNGEQLGYATRGAVNLPLTDTLAIRASGFSREDPGYVNDILSGARDVNKQVAYGGRVSALWRPSEAFSVKLSAFLQQDTTNGLNGITVGDGTTGLQQVSIPNAGASSRRYEVFAANLTGKIGSVDLVAVSGYSIDTRRDSLDVTYLLSGLLPPYFSVGGVDTVEYNRTHKFTQEVRASTRIADKFDLLIGGFYDHESSPYDQEILAEDIPTGVIAGSLLCFCWKATYQEHAIFTDLTIHFTERFDVQLGGREGWSQQSYSEVDIGPIVPLVDGVPSSPYDYGTRESNDKAFTYLVTPRVRFSKDLMAYIRLASGYQPGGPQDLPQSYPIPNSYQPDKTQNYELGVKGNTPNQLLAFDASVYYISWKDIQLSGVFNGLGYLTNGSKAKSQGLELSGQLRPVTGLQISGWIALNDAQLTGPLLPGSGLYGVPGDRLPYSARFTGSISVEDEFSITGGLSGFVGAAESYVGARNGAFQGTATRPYLPAYAKLDLHAGVKYESWSISLFANNVTNKLGYLGYDSPPYVYIVQPRTVGLSVSKVF